MVGHIIKGVRAAVLLVAAGLMTTAFAPSAFGEAQGQKSKQEMSQKKTQKGMSGERAGTQTLLRADSLVGMEVHNDQHEALGKIEEIAIDPSMKEASYAAMSVGDELVAVPITALDKRHGNNFLVLDISKSELQKAPTFSEDNYPAKADAAFWQAAGVPSPGMQQKGMQGEQPKGMQGEQTKGMQGEQPKGMQGEQQQGMQGEQEAVHKLSEVKDFKVQSTDGKEIGTLSDILIETNQGRLVYGVVTFSDVEGLQDRMAIVPFEKLNARAEQKTVQVNADIDTLKSVAFMPNNYPSLDQRYLSRISRSFNTEPYWQVFGYPPPQPQLPPQQEEEAAEQKQQGESKSKQTEQY